jgi:hypothetical protein
VTDQERRAKVEARAARIPPRFRGVYQRAMEGKSRAAAVRAKCQECVGYEDVTEQVRGCTDPACPLWPMRPYQASSPGVGIGPDGEEVEPIEDEDREDSPGATTAP